jgi:hypothetical protein
VVYVVQPGNAAMRECKVGGSKTACLAVGDGWKTTASTWKTYSSFTQQPADSKPTERPDNTLSLDELQRRRLGEQSEQERQRQAQTVTSDRVIAEFLSVGEGAVDALHRTGLRFRQLGDDDFDAIRIKGHYQFGTGMQWRRCGTGQAQLLRISTNPYTKGCNGIAFAPQGGPAVYLFADVLPR